MTCSPKDFLHTAEFLATKGETEACFRSAVSRAYYASLHSAIAFHDSLGSMGSLSEYPGGTHEAVIQRLANPTIGTADPRYNRSKAVAYMLRQFRKTRNDADYGLGLNFSTVDAVGAVAVAHKISDKISESGNSSAA